MLKKIIPLNPQYIYSGSFGKEYTNWLNSFSNEERLQLEHYRWLTNNQKDSIHETISTRGTMECSHLMTRNNLLERLKRLSFEGLKNIDDSVTYTARLRTKWDKGQIRHLKRNLRKQGFNIN